MMGRLNKGIRYEAVTVGAVLVLGIGVTAAVFRARNAGPVEPLRFRDPSSLRVSRITARNPVSPANYPDWKSRNHVFGDLAAVVGMRRMSLTGAGEPQELLAGAVTANFFQRIGVQPMVGRAFLPGENQRGREHVAILSHRLWRRHFGGDPHIVGKSITLNGESHHVVGILPPDFAWNNRRTDIWVPYVIDRDRDYRAAGREKPQHNIKTACFPRGSECVWLSRDQRERSGYLHKGNRPGGASVHSSAHLLDSNRTGTNACATG